MFDDDDSLHCSPRLRRLVQLVAGVIAPACIFMVGIASLVTGSTPVPPGRGGGSAFSVTGSEGTVLAFTYLAGAAFLHFHIYWRWSERLEPYSAWPRRISFVIFMCLALGAPFFWKSS